jgi:hypothetical protein
LWISLGPLICAIENTSKEAPLACANRTISRPAPLASRIKMTALAATSSGGNICYLDMFKMVIFNIQLVIFELSIDV